jgi:L-iditol 2-dehydrogenase
MSRRRLLSILPHHGTLTRYHVHPEEWLHALPDSLSYEEGSLLEPLSVGLARIDHEYLKLGDAVVICGAGPIGLAILLAANAAGAEPIVITDLDENRLRTARQLVPRVRPVLVDRTLSAKDLAEESRSHLPQRRSGSLNAPVWNQVYRPVFT